MPFDLESTREKLRVSNPDDLIIEGLLEVVGAGKLAVPLISEVVACLHSFYGMSLRFGDDVSNTETAAYAVGALLPEAELSEAHIVVLSRVAHASRRHRSFINASENARSALRSKGLEPLPLEPPKPKPGPSEDLVDLRSAMKANKLTRREPKLLYLVAKKLEPAHVSGREGLFEEMQTALSILLAHGPSQKFGSPGYNLADELLRLAAALLPHPAADRTVFEGYLTNDASPKRQSRARACLKRTPLVNPHVVLDGPKNTPP